MMIIDNGDGTRWESSPGRHGLWRGTERIAYIGITPKFSRPRFYHWIIGYGGTGRGGTVETLKKAKRAILDVLELNH